MSKSRKRPIEIDDLFTIRLVSDPAISPDGERLAWVVTILDKDDDTYKAAIWISDLSGENKRQLTSGSHRDTHPRWSPDGHRIAFVSNRPSSDGKDDETRKSANAETSPSQIWTIDPDGGEAVQLTSHPNGASSPDWSPDARRVAFVATDDVDEDSLFEAPVSSGGKADEIIVNDIRYRYDGRGLLKQFSHIWAIDVSSRTTVALTSGDVNDNSPKWSPDGRTIAFLGNRRDDRRQRHASTVQLVPSNGGEVRTIAPDDALFGSLSWSPDGKRIAFIGHEDAQHGHARNNGVWTVEPDGSRLENHTSNIDITFTDVGMSDLSTGSGSSPLWSSSDSLLVQGSRRGATHLYQLPLDSKKASPITGERERVTQADVLPGGKTIAYIVGTASTPFRLCTCSPKGKRVTTIHDPNSELTQAVDLAEPTDLTVTSPDGTEVQAWLLPPHGLKKGASVKYPLIVQIHGGPHGMYGHAMFHEMQVMASRGYGVLYCNPRGSSGYGETLTGITRGTWGESDMPDVIAALDAALEEPWVDSDRLGITGGSYGGYLTNWIISHDTRFKAAVSQRCVSNFHSFVGTSDIGFDFGIHEFDGTPWADAEKLLKYSPISYVDKIETPLLILHSEQDLRCPIEQAEQLYTALKYLGKDVAFVRIPGESHNLSRSGTPSRRVARLHHLIGWFDNHL